MRLEYLKEFIMVAETLSFSSTAKRLYLTQSVLSKHIASMEEDLDAKLFIRDSHHVRLTNMGKVFLEDAKRIVEMYNQAIMHLDALKESYDTVVRVGYLRNAARPFLAQYKKWFLQKAPSMKLCLWAMEYGELMDALAARKVDIALTIDVGAGVKSRCETLPIYQDCYCAVVSYDHPLASQTSVTAEELLGERLILPDPAEYPGLDKFFANMFPPGSALAATSYYRDIDTLYLSVEMGEGIAFSSGHNRELFENRVRFLPLADMDSCYFVSAMWLKDADSEVIGPCREILSECRVDGLPSYSD